MADPISSAVLGAASTKIYNPLDYYYNNVANGMKRRVPRAKALSWLAPLNDRFTARKEVTKEYSFYQEGQYMQASATIAVVGTSGDKRLLTLSAGDHDTALVANDSSFPIEGMLVVFQDGQTNGYVESVDRTTPGAHIVTVKKTDSGQDIAGQSIVGNTIVFYANVQKEGSGKQASRTPKFDKITNKMHTLRDDFEVTDHIMQNAVEFQDPITGQKYIHYRGIEDTAERFEMQKELMLLLAPNSVDLTDKNAEALQTAHGMLPQIEKYGTVIEYYDRPDKASFDELKLAIDNGYGDDKYFVGRGHNCVNGMTDWLVEFAKAGTGQISFSPFDSGKEQAISLNFKSYAVDEYEFYFNKFDLFSHKDTLGAANMPFRHYAAFIPAGYGKNPNPLIKGTGESDSEPYFKVVYQDPQSAPNTIYGSAETGGTYAMFETGGLAKDGPTDATLTKNVTFNGYCALEMRARNKFFLWKKRTTL